MNRCSNLVGRRLAFLVGTFMALTQAALGNPSPQGLGDPGALQSLSVETGRTSGGEFLLNGADVSQQLLVTGHFAGGQVRDLTRAVAYEVLPEGVVTVSSSGMVQPRADGSATITARTTTGTTSRI